MHLGKKATPMTPHKKWLQSKIDLLDLHSDLLLPFLLDLQLDLLKRRRWNDPGDLLSFQIFEFFGGIIKNSKKWHLCGMKKTEKVFLLLSNVV